MKRCSYPRGEATGGDTWGTSRVEVGRMRRPNSAGPPPSRLPPLLLRSLYFDMKLLKCDK